MMTLLVIAMLPLWLVGLVVFLGVAMPIKKRIQSDTGYDVSNRINRIRLLWLWLRRPWIVLTDFDWSWLKKDEFEK